MALSPSLRSFSSCVPNSHVLLATINGRPGSLPQGQLPAIRAFSQHAPLVASAHTFTFPTPDIPPAQQAIKAGAHQQACA